MKKKEEQYEKTLESELFGDRKRKRRFTDTWFGLFLTTAFIFIVGGIFGELIKLPIWFLKSGFASVSDEIETAAFYFSFIGMWGFAISWCMIFEKNRPVMKILTKLKGNNLKLFALGLGIGFIMNGICILMAYLNKNIELEFSKFNIITLVLIFIAVLIQSSAEEFICRGFLYYRLQKSYDKPIVSVLVSAVLFGVIHMFNPGVTILSILNIILFGILFALIVYYFDSMWCACAAHTAWNYTQNIIFGLPNSGNVLPYSIFKLDQETAVNGVCYNTGFGVEGTFIAVIILLAGSGVLYIFGKKNKCNNRFDIWGDVNN